MNWRQPNECGARRSREALSAGLMSLLLVLLLVLGGCGGSEPSAPPPAVSPAAPSATDMTGVTVETGGMALPSPADGATGAAGATGAPGTEPPSAPTAAETPVLAVGDVITTTAAADLYAEPDPTGPRFAEYAAGSRLTVVEPDGDWTVYPVQVEGSRWVRVRAEDGLVGWMMEAVVAVE